MNLNILLHTGKIKKNSFFSPTVLQEFRIQYECTANNGNTKYICRFFLQKNQIKDFTLDYLMNLRD